MAVVIPEDLWPTIVVGQIYRLKPTTTGGQWVRIVAITDGIVYAEGYAGTIADLELPIERFYNALAYPAQVAPF